MNNLNLCSICGYALPDHAVNCSELSLRSKEEHLAIVREQTGQGWAEPPEETNDPNQKHIMTGWDMARLAADRLLGRDREDLLQLIGEKEKEFNAQER